MNRETFEKGLTRLDRLLALERAARNLDGQAGTNAASIARTRGRVAELDLQILQLDARRIEEAEEQARDAKAQENQVAGTPRPGARTAGKDGGAGAGTGGRLRNEGGGAGRGRAAR